MFVYESEKISMEEQFLHNIISRRARRRRHILEKRRKLLKLRKTTDPFNVTEESFQKNYRLPKNICADLISELEQHDNQSSAIPFRLRFLAALYFFGHGSYQQCVGNAFGNAMSQSSISRSIFNITRLIVQHKRNEISFPQRENEQTALKLGFYNKFGIKGTIGAVDCTHVSIVTPSSADTENPVKLYMNRKGFYSVNVEAICDHRLIFTSLNAKFPGSCHDSGIWTTSPARISLLRNHRPGQSTWLLEDQGYPLEPWLLTPFATPSTPKQRMFNKMHAKARNTVERAFGVLKGRFRCLSKERVLYYSHERVAYIIYACAILHNILIKNGIELEESDEEDIDVDFESVDSEPLPARAMQYFREGTRLRESYVSSLEPSHSN